MTTYRKAGDMRLRVQVTHAPEVLAPAVDPWETPIEATLLGENALPTIVASPYVNQAPAAPVPAPVLTQRLPLREEIRGGWASGLAEEAERKRRKAERRSRRAA